EATRTAIQALSGEATGVLGAVRGTLGQIQGVADAIDLTSSGRKIMSTLAAGIRSGTSEAVAAMSEAAQRIKNHVPQSPAKEGPLRGLSGIGIMTEIARTMDPAPMTSAMDRAASATLARLDTVQGGRLSGGNVPRAGGRSWTAGAGGPSVGAIHVQVNVGGSNASPDDIAHAVGGRVRDVVRGQYSDGGI
ncbi:MAG: hypothetical protein AAFZ09_19340, partial [Pseudomonadota bacterium]